MSNWMRNRRRWGPRPGEFPLGSLKSRAAARATQLAAELEARQQQAALFGNLTPQEKVFCEGARGSKASLYLARAMISKSKLFGFPLPTLQQMRHRWRVLREVDKVEQERAARGDTAFLDEKSVREMAEERLLREDQRAAQTASTTARSAEAAD